MSERTWVGRDTLLLFLSLRVSEVRSISSNTQQKHNEHLRPDFSLTTAIRRNDLLFPPLLPLAFPAAAPASSLAQLRLGPNKTAAMDCEIGARLRYFLTVVAQLRRSDFPRGRS